MEKQKQVIAEGSWNSTRISKQDKQTAVSLLFIPDKSRACNICLSWYIFEQGAWKEIVQIGTKEKRTPFYPILTFPQFWMVMVWSSNVLASTFRFLHPLCLSEREKNAAWATVYCKSLLGGSPEYCPFLKEKAERQNERQKIRAKTFKVKWFSSLKSAFISL